MTHQMMRIYLAQIMNGVPTFLGLKFQVTLTEFKTIHKRRLQDFLGFF